MRTLSLAVGSLLLCITLTLTAFAVWLLLKGNDPEHAALAGGIFILSLVVPMAFGRAGRVCGAHARLNGSIL
jgi:hypothetical protein